MNIKECVEILKSDINLHILFNPMYSAGKINAGKINDAKVFAIKDAKVFAIKVLERLDEKNLKELIDNTVDCHSSSSMSRIILTELTKE